MVEELRKPREKSLMEAEEGGGHEKLHFYRQGLGHGVDLPVWRSPLS